MFLAIVRATPNGRVAKYAEFPTLAEAKAHVAERGGFAVEKPSAPWPHWMIDMDAQTISIDVPPPEPRQVDYVTFLDRLSDADAEAVVSFVDGLPAKRRAHLQHRGLWSDDQPVRDWLTARGYDPDAVLA